MPPSRKNQKHGFSGTKFYRTYSRVFDRCTNIRNENYRHYGGKGIKCLWPDFPSFRDDMYVSYLEHVAEHGEEDTSIDRIDCNGNYCKENCRWATRSVQNRNREAANIMITIDGVTRCLTEWSEINGISPDTARNRLRQHGWSAHDAVTIPSKQRHRNKRAKTAVLQKLS